ncbi:hypothetical protein AB9P05_15235 [Roseivirga sp. BDSF3-8]|uniref:hypothetical protein n=1 Tax=Roseivirga sp. BDSF3-8 TaxID=3241598 RepID=UPI00353231A1
MSTLRHILLLYILCLTMACERSSSENQAPSHTTPEEAVSPDTSKSNKAAFANAIGTAHGLERWKNKKAIKADIRVVFSGNERLNGSMVAETSVGRVRIELEDGTRLVWDGQKAWVSPDTSSFSGARFHLRTWPYFLAAPMKFRDPGTLWQEMEEEELMGQEYNRHKLTFKKGIGDSPDDWYVIYKDPESDKLKAMAYVVTYATPLEKANEEPHIIVYDNYEEVEGTMLSTEWTFYNWSEEKGLHGDSIGYVILENLAFTDPADSLFSKPDNAKEDPMPSGS